MASPQLENGYIAIAHDLYVAIDRADISQLERRILSGVMYFTYGSGKTKTDLRAEDIRYYLGADKKLRTDRIEEAITRLIQRRILFRQALVNGGQLLGIQKDYDLWNDKSLPATDKMSPTLRDEDINTNTNNPYKGADKMSPPERLLDYAMRKSNFKYGLGAYRTELKYAKQLYIEALSLTRSPLEALYLLKDYIDQDEWMRKNVKMQFTYMSSRFAAWVAQIPRKPRWVKESEEALGKRHRYNVRTDTWEVT